MTILGPYSGERLTSLAQLDAALNRAAEARNVSEHNFLESLGSFYLDLVPVNADPFSMDYKMHWYEVYEWLAGRPYVVANEFFDFDVPAHIKSPYPFCTQDFRIVSKQLMGIGKVIEVLALPRGSKILEMGAGWGNTSLFLAQMGYDVTVVDINAKYGEVINSRAQALNVNVKFKNMSYEDAINLNEKFDCVLFFESFHHSFDPFALLNALPKLIAEDGFLALAGEPLYEDLPYEWGLNLAGEALWQIRTHGWFELVFRESYLIRALLRAGFKVKKTELQGNAIGTTFICYPSVTF